MYFESFPFCARETTKLLSPTSQTISFEIPSSLYKGADVNMPNKKDRNFAEIRWTIFSPLAKR